jgi:diamine N-acetyltransferase
MEIEQDYQLRLCVPGDEEKLSLIGAASFLEAFAGSLEGADLLQHCKHQHSTEKYAYWLNFPGYFLCLLEIKGAPVGYAVLCPPDLPLVTTPDDIELKRIYLLHRFQKTGMGSALMIWSIEQAVTLGKERLLLGVNAGNEKALSFYSRHRFATIGTRKFQVGTMLCDDYILARDLPSN